MFKKQYFVILFNFISFFTFADTQIPDLIIYKNDTLPVYNLIVEEYLNSKNYKKEGDLFGLSFREGAQSNFWRGYQAIYKIENDSLFLVKLIDKGFTIIEDSTKIEEVSVTKFERFFKDKIKNGKVFVDWFSGNINLKNGDLLTWDGVFRTTYTKEISLNFMKGKFKNSKEIVNYIDLPNGINRKYNDSLSSKIFRIISDVDWKSLNEFEWTNDKYLIIIGKKGKIKKIELENKKEFRLNVRIWGNQYKKYQKTIYSKLKNLQFDIIRENGKNISQKIIIYPE